MPEFLRHLPRPLRLFWWTLVGATALCAVTIAFCRFVMHWHYPYSTPFFPFYYWLDFFDFRIRFTHFHTPDFFNPDRSKGWIFSYPPPMGLLYKLAYLPPAHLYFIFNLVVVPLCGWLAWLLIQALLRRDVSKRVAYLFVGSACLLSYPFFFNYFLGNFEICVFLIVAFAIVALLRGRDYTAAAMIGIAGSMKLFPFFLLGLLLARRKYLQIVWGLLVGAALYLFATWAECPDLGVAFRGMQRGANAMRESLIVKWISIENGFDHSLFALFKRLSHSHYGGAIPARSLSIYMAVVAVAGILLFFFRIIRLPFLNQLTSLYIACVLLPPMSHHYTLMHLYVPWALFVLYAIDRQRQGLADVPGLAAIMVCLGLLFAPESEFFIHHSSFGGQIKCVVLIVLWVLVLTRRFASRWDTPASVQTA